MIQQPSVPTEPPSFTPTQRQVLAALGVPLYVRRALSPTRGQGVETRPDGGAAVNRAPVAEQVAPRRAAGPAPSAPRYTLSFAELGCGVLICDRGSVPLGRFARDVALALGSEVPAPAVNTLDWPGALPGALAADALAAREAARGLLDGMLDGRRDAIVVLLGEQAVRQLAPVATADAPPEGQAEVAGNHWYWNHGGYHLVDTKRALWGFIRSVLNRS